MKRVLLLLITFILIPWDIWSQTPRDLCQPPTNITVVDISTDSATITWTRGGTETAWELAVGNSVFYLTDTFYTVHYLDSNTTYNITVRAICDVGDTSIATSGIFHTPCYFLRSLPYYNDFESEPHYSIGGTSRWDAFPECWTRINDGTSNAYYPHITNESENVINGNKSMCFQHYGYANNEYAVLPPVETNLLGPIANLHISFYAKGSVVSAPFPMFIVGVMDSPDDRQLYRHGPICRFPQSAHPFTIRCVSRRCLSDQSMVRTSSQLDSHCFSQRDIVELGKKRGQHFLHHTK